ncbi:MAG: nuclear transport factor 2 family protein [Gammaproteobacteria bacterium]|nr:nuclear transport factor 2 family protein [Gammaproteobacteria bacterium]
MTGCATGPGDPSATRIPGKASNSQAEVIATEKAFARTMKRRDLKAFSSFLADEVIFMSGDKPLRGKLRVTENWQKYFNSKKAPFSWYPERVEVMESAGLALSAGPVLNPDGETIGTFTSVWRRDDDGKWRIIFDKGGCACDTGPE